MQITSRTCGTDFRINIFAFSMSSKKQEKSNPSAKKSIQQTKQSSDKGLLLWLAGVLLLTAIAFSPSLKNGFTNWDDNVYIGENDLIKSLKGDNIKKMFDTDNHVSLNYHPITILSLAIDYKLSGYHPKTYHITNLLFHLLNTALVFWFIFLLSNKKIMVAAIVALFFGIHPMHVESVAWISERKDVLYTFFFMGALVAYYNYLNAEGKNKIGLYVFILLLFLLSILSKAMAVVLPVVFLLIDYYKGRKFDIYVILEKIPFFLLSFVFGYMALRIQSEGAAIAKYETFTLLERLSFPAYGIIVYICKLFVPTHLSCFYPYPHLVDGHLPTLFYVCPLIIVLVFVLILWNLKKSNPARAGAFGFLFFSITIALVLQFISVGQVILAERYSYIPYIGLLFPIAMSYEWLQQQTDKKFSLYKQLSMPVFILFAIICAWLTFERTKVWKNSDVLWTDAIKKFPDSEAAYRNRGSYLINKKAYDLGEKKVGEMEIDRALEDFNISIHLNPNSAKVFTNRANIFGLKGRFDLALADYSKAIELDSTDEQTFFNRAVTYSMMKNFDKAIEDYNTAITMKPDFIAAKKSRAYAYVDIREYDKAITDLNEVILLDPSNANNYFYRGTALYNIGDFSKALADYTITLQLNPENSGAYFNRSMANRSLGKFTDALNDALKAQSLGFNVSADYINALKAKAR